MKRPMIHLLLWLVALCLVCGRTMAQGGSCSDENVLSHPGRPAMTNGADPTQCGVVELEYGLERSWKYGSHGNALAGGLRFGITSDLDLHWSAGDFLNVVDPAGNRSGYGDNWIGFAYRYLKQAKWHPSLGVMYMAKIPTGESDLDLCSGEFDHVLIFMVSKDVHRVHLDFNVGPQWMGVAHSSPDQDVALSLAASLPATKRITVVVESHGETALNPATSAYASLMTGLSLQVHPRLYFDGGFDNGVTPGGPGKRVSTPAWRPWQGSVRQPTRRRIHCMPA